jgi:hypothetical protein
MANPVPPQSANIAVPDWTTRTEWAPSETKYGWIRPITSLDTGNRPLNVLLNKVVLPWSNLAAALIDAPIAMLREVDDRLKHSRFSVEYEAAPYVFPADGVFEFGAEAGPAIKYGLTWISSSRRLRNLATAPAYWFLSAGGIGGSSLGRTLAAAGKTIEEAGALKAGDGLKALDTGPGKVLRTFEAGANMADSAANFELAKAGTESGTGYFLDGVQFEGYENRALVDAKAWSDTGRMNLALRNQVMWAGWKVVNQAARQLAVARAHGLSVEWRFLGQETAEIVQEILRINGLDIRIVY